jgi:NADP-dependent 3-hydroxy acid dehydrogenase YdfG
MSYKVWFITGASRGFGRVWADAALKRGDKVAATARTLASIGGLKEKYGANVLTLELDVTKPDQAKQARGSSSRSLRKARYRSQQCRLFACGHD